MIKVKKGFVLSLLLSVILVPTIASAGVYFMEKDECKPGPGVTCTRGETIRPCNTRGFKLTIDRCGINEQGINLCPEDDRFFRACGCDTTKYTKTQSECVNGQTPMGEYCKGQWPIPKYERCDCDTSQYKYVKAGIDGGAGTSQCPEDKEVYGAVCKKNNGTELFQGCKCLGIFKETCAYPFVGDGQECDGKFQRCLCGSEYKRCDDGGRGASCSDAQGTKYKQCYSDLPQIQIAVVDGMFKQSSRGCNDATVDAGIEGAKVTFSKNKESDIVAYTNGDGILKMHAPFDKDDENIKITIEKTTEGKYEEDSTTDYITLSDTCPCSGRVYALSPKKLNESQDVRVITIWGSTSWVNTSQSSRNIADVDTHLVTETGGHVYHGDKTGTGQYAPVKVTGGINLDVDDRHCFGPETMTIPNAALSQNGGKFYYAVNQFSSSPTGNEAFFDSWTMTYVYVNGELKRIFKIEKAQKNYPGAKGTLWSVFSIDSNKTIMSINKLKAAGTGNSGLPGSIDKN